MKLALQYLNDKHGKPQAVQWPISDWEKVLAKLKKYEQTLKIRSDLKEAYEEVALLRNSTVKKQSLTEFLNEL
jgi:hypothetical protein